MSSRTADLSSRRVFVDTSAYDAATIERDSRHAMVGATIERLVRDRRRLDTTNVVLAELHALVLTRGSAAAALRALERIRSSASTTVVRVTRHDEERA